MRGARFVEAAVAALLATTLGCGASVTPEDSAGSEAELGTVAGRLQIVVPPSPGDVASIHVAVTGVDIPAPLGADLVRQGDGSWAGSVLDVPPGTGCRRAPRSAEI